MFVSNAIFGIFTSQVCIMEDMIMETSRFIGEDGPMKVLTIIPLFQKRKGTKSGNWYGSVRNAGGVYEAINT